MFREQPNRVAAPAAVADAHRVNTSACRAGHVDQAR
jgi:hypothetical protein